jgi:hypothetical protein
VHNLARRSQDGLDSTGHTPLAALGKAVLGASHPYSLGLPLTRVSLYIEVLNPAFKHTAVCYCILDYKRAVTIHISSILVLSRQRARSLPHLILKSLTHQCPRDELRPSQRQ